MTYHRYVPETFESVAYCKTQVVLNVLITWKCIMYLLYFGCFEKHGKQSLSLLRWALQINQYTTGNLLVLLQDLLVPGTVSKPCGQRYSYYIVCPAVDQGMLKLLLAWLNHFDLTKIWGTTTEWVTHMKEEHTNSWGYCIDLSIYVYER